jgi:hypothetical protein
MISLWIRLIGISLLLTLPGCGGGSRSALPGGGELGQYEDLETPESYTGATLYAYMNGGAELYLREGFSQLAVRRYSRGSDELIAELFEMKDSESAARMYDRMRRPETEAEIIPGCVASIEPAEVVLVRGLYLLVCRNEDPMATDETAVRDLASLIAARLPGPDAD